MFVLIKKRMI